MAVPSEGFQAPMELAHVMGYSGRHGHTLIFHPTEVATDAIIYAIGRLLLLADLGDPHKQLILRGHDADITCLDVSRSGKFLCSGQAATPAGDGTAPIFIWNYTTQAIVYVLREHHGGILSVAFSDDDRWIASVGVDARVCIWDMENGRVSGGVKETVNLGSRATPKWVKWCPVEVLNTRRPRYTLCTGYEKEVRIGVWEFAAKTMAFGLTQTPCQVPQSGGGLLRYYSCGEVSVDGHYCLAGSTSGDLIVYTVANAAIRCIVPVASNVLCCASVDASTVMVGSGDGTLKKVVGRDKDWRVAHSLNLLGGVTNITVSPDRQELVVGTNAGVIYRVLVMDMSFTTLMQSHVTGIRGLAFSPHRSDTFITCGDDGYIRQWDLSDYSMSSYFTLNVNPNKVSPSTIPCAVCYMPEGAQVLSGWSDGYIRLLDLGLEKGTMLWHILNAHKGSITAIASASQYFCTAGEDLIVRVWAHQNRELLLQIAEHKKPISGLVVDNTTESIVHTTSLDKNLFTYEIMKSELARGPKRLTYHCDVEGSGFTCCTQRWDHEHEMVVGTADGRLLVFDIDYPQPTAVAADPARSRVNAIALAPSSAYVACGMVDGRLVLFDLRASPPRLLGFTRLHFSDITSVRWSPDERQLITCGHDCAICVWNFYGLAA
eukprot:GGOE01000544.1.p1 GENE.GGOE01000544.1~~GGOE01000544.1.p1  ORF type:complete len:658 (-),score=173.29 GGOE01000544.1:177-2150(-)